jgi:3-oxoadipate enol-lactonase
MDKRDFTLHFEDSGQGPPLLLIHGFPFSSRMWNRQLETLSGQAHMFAPDLPGFGDSPLLDSSYTVERYAEDCTTILDALDIMEPIAVGGLSMGGYIALAFARLFPERVSALLLLSTRSGADSVEGKAGREKTIAAVKEHGASAVTEAMYPKLLAPAAYESNPAAAAELQETMRSASSEGIVAALGAMRDRPDSTSRLADLQMPTLIIHGREDQVIPFSEAEAMAKAIPHSDLHLISNAGHLPNLEQPDEFNGIISGFLQRQ